MQKRSAEVEVDRVVSRARARADEVLTQAREKADDTLEAAGPGGRPGRKVVEKEREREDSVLQAERDAADALLQREREGQEQLLETLLVTERANTDRYLLTERGRSDDAIAHRDDFLGMVSHDLRNHLNVINLTAGVLSAQAPDNPEGRRQLDGMKRIQRHVAHMGRLVGDLVDVVSIEAGRLSIRPAPRDAARLLAEAVASMAASAAEKNIELSVEGRGQPLPGEFDSQRMLQVLTNLLSNAIKFTPPGGVVVVRGQSTADELRLSVRDSGPGVPAAMQQAVFERFWQVNHNDQRGLGLGLYISRSIVEGHGGTIRLDSTPGHGATFTCIIPRGAAATA